VARAWKGGKNHAFAALNEAEISEKAPQAIFPID
jgi:hypothetical protein